MCKCCFGDVEGEACGWPKGSVRALVAILTIPISFISALVVMIILIIKEQYLVAVGINGVIFGVIGTIIGHYYGSKSAEGAAKLISDTEHELIESRNMEIQARSRSIDYHSINNNNDNNNNNRNEMLETI